MSEQNGKDPNEYFFKIHYYMVKTEAWLSLSTPARAIYIQICSRYITNKNNGKLAYSVRDAVKECRIDKKTAIRAFKELVALGFIEKAKANNRVSRRNATEWRLTAFDCNLTGAKASRAFLERGFEAIASRQSRQRPRPAPRAPQPEPKQAVRTVRSVHTRGGNDYPLRGKRLPTEGETTTHEGRLRGKRLPTKAGFEGSSGGNDYPLIRSLPSTEGASSSSGAERAQCAQSGSAHPHTNGATLNGFDHGLYLRGGVLWARARVGGKERRTSLHTADHEQARERRAAWLGGITIKETAS